MSLLRSMAVGVVLSVLGVSSAHAALVTETWQSTITSVNHTAFAVNDTFSWTVTYDNSSLRMHQYRDGADGRSDHGTNDDTLDRTWCTGVESYGIGCNSSSGSTYSFFADATFDVSEYYVVMEAAGFTGRDIYNTNMARRYNQTSPAHDFFDLKADDLFFYNASAWTYWTTAQGEQSRAESTLSSRLMSTQPASVPEPASIVLMGLGLVGIGFSRMKKAA